MKKLVLSILVLLFLAVPAYARVNFLWRNAVLSTGGSNALANIAHTSLTSGQPCLVATLGSGVGSGSWWIYDSTGTNSNYPTDCTEDTCTRVAPTSGGGAWYRVTFKAAAFQSAAPDGYHYIEVSNSSGFSGTPAEGYCYYDKALHAWCCYDTDSWNCIDMTTGSPPE